MNIKQNIRTFLEQLLFMPYLIQLVGFLYSYLNKNPIALAVFTGLAFANISWEAAKLSEKEEEEIVESYAEKKIIPFFDILWFFLFIIFAYLSGHFLKAVLYSIIFSLFGMFFTYTLAKIIKNRN